MNMIGKIVVAFSLMAMMFPGVAQASGPILVEYGEETFLVEHRAGYVGMYRSDQRGMAKEHIASEEAKGYRNLGLVAERLREFKQLARQRQLPVEDFSPYFPGVEIEWGRDGKLGYSKEYTWHNYAPGVLGKEIHFPANILIEHEDNTVTLTISKKLEPAQMKLLRDMLIKQLNSVKTDRSGAEAIDPEQLSVPVVMIEKERYVVCARMLTPMTQRVASEWKDELGELASAVDSALAQPIAALDAAAETKGMLKTVVRGIREPGDERELVPENVCGRNGPNWSDKAEYELETITAKNNTLDLRVLIATTKEDWEQHYGPVRETLGPVLTRAIEEQIAKLEYDNVIRAEFELESLNTGSNGSFRWVVIAGTASLILLIVIVVVVRRRKRR